MTQNELDAVAMYNWIAERFQYIVCVILIIISATFYTVFTPDPYHHPGWKRGFSIAMAVILMGLIVGGLTNYFGWNWFASSLVSVTLGMGAPKLSFWLLRIWQTSDSPQELLSEVGKVGKAYNAAKDAWVKSTTEEKEDQPPDKPD